MTPNDSSRVPRLPSAALCLALSLLAACSDPVLNLVLRTPDGGPFPTVVQTLSVRVLSDDGEVLGQNEQAYAPGDVSLPAIEWRRDLWFYVAGLTQEGALSAWADLRPSLPEDPRDCCVFACFCTTAQWEAGACTCSSTTCDGTCP